METAIGQAMSAIETVTPRPAVIAPRAICFFSLLFVHKRMELLLFLCAETQTSYRTGECEVHGPSAGNVRGIHALQVRHKSTLYH